MRDLQRSYDTKFCILMECKQVEKELETSSKGLVSMGPLSRMPRAIPRAWCLWDQSVWKVKVLRQSNQSVNIEVQWKNDNPWFLTIMYGSPHVSRRQQLWGDISNISWSISGARALIGDFNCTLSIHDCRGGSSSQDHTNIDLFRQAIHECKPLDAGFQGDPFMWKKCNKEVRLEHCHINLAWRLRFRQTFVQHLPHLKSDHRLLLMCASGKARKNLGRRPLRFEAAWLTHDLFPSFMRDHL